MKDRMSSDIFVVKKVHVHVHSPSRQDAQPPVPWRHTVEGAICEESSPAGVCSSRLLEKFAFQRRRSGGAQCATTWPFVRGKRVHTCANSSPSVVALFNPRHTRGHPSSEVAELPAGRGPATVHPVRLVETCCLLCASHLLGMLSNNQPQALAL